MIPIPSVEDMELIDRGIRLNFHKLEELTDEQVQRILEHYKGLKDIKDSFDESITGEHTGII